MSSSGHDAKANPDAGPSVTHEFDCTHDPCTCSSTEDGPTLALATTRQLLEELCRRLDAADRHQQACEVAGLAFRLPDDVLDHRTVEPWWQ